MCGTPNDDLKYYYADILNRHNLWVFGFNRKFNAKDGDTMNAKLVSSDIKLILNKLVENPEIVSGFEEFYLTTNPIKISSLESLDNIILDKKVQILKL